MQPIIWHNPSCSKSRATLELLKEHGFEPQVRLYLNEPPLAQELSVLWDRLGPDHHALVRVKESAFKEQNMVLAESTKDELIELLVRIPRLIERPVVFFNGRAAIGRPPERVLAILT